MLAASGPVSSEGVAPVHLVKSNWSLWSWEMPHHGAPWFSKPQYHDQGAGVAGMGASRAFVPYVAGGRSSNNLLRLCIILHDII